MASRKPGDAWPTPPDRASGELPAERTVVDDQAAREFQAAFHDRDKKTIAQRKPRPPDPAAVPEDSGNLLLDSTTEEEDPEQDTLSAMPTAVAPNVLQGSTRPSPAAPAAPARLVVIGGNDRGREFALMGPETTVGRGTDNDVILTDIAVSRRHVSLAFTGNRYTLKDHGSGNGTLVNGVRLSGEAFVRDGDQIEIGNTLLRFEHNQPSVVAEVPAYLAQPPHPAPAPPVHAQPPVAVAAFSAPLPIPSPPSASYPAAPAHYAQTVPPLPRTPVRTPEEQALRRTRMLFLFGAIGLLFVIAGGAWLLRSSTAPSTASLADDGGSEALDNLLENMEAPPAQAAPPIIEPAVAAGDEAPERSARDKALEAAGMTIEPAEKPAPDTAKDEPDPPAEKAVKKDPPRKAPPRKAPPKKAAPRKTPPRKVARSSSQGASGVEGQAFGLYKSGEFDKAIDLLRHAADEASGKEADRLANLSRAYAAVRLQLTRGDALARSSPEAALIAYQKALKADAGAGKGVHGGSIKKKLASVAPAAATRHMAARRYPQARDAADAAVRYGAGNDPQVKKVQAGLEVKAREMYVAGVRESRKNLQKAKTLWRQVLKMVPSSSHWYSKAYAALNRPARGPVDEDE